MADGRCLIQEPLKLYEARNVQRTALICIGETPDWMRPRLSTSIMVMAGLLYPSA